MDVGMWLDRHQAYLVKLKKDGQHIVCIESEVEGKYKPSGKTASASTGSPRQLASDRKADERRRHQLNQYYQQIAAKVKTADRIYIFGPGQAKGELEKELKDGQRLSAKVEAVESADKMTVNQMAAQVRAFFEERTN